MNEGDAYEAMNEGDGDEDGRLWPSDDDDDDDDDGDGDDDDDDDATDLGGAAARHGAQAAGV